MLTMVKVWATLLKHPMANWYPTANWYSDPGVEPDAKIMHVVEVYKRFKLPEIQFGLIYLFTFEFPN